MAYETILYDADQGVATVTLNRPDRLNAWTRAMEREIRSALDQAMADEAVRVVVLTGAGRGFCAGADMDLLSGVQGGSGADETAPATRPFDMEIRGDFQTRYSYFPGLPKPILAAINGPCAGLGLIMALYCDIRFAAETAVFTTAFSRRGLIAEHGISWLLPRLIGLQGALDLTLSGRKFGADEALRLGLVAQVFRDADFQASVRAYALDLAANVSPRSMKVMKRQLYEAQFQTLAEAVTAANREMQGSFQSDDFKEGVAHFVEKRPARFTGT